MTIRQPVINTFKRVGINYQLFDNTEKKVTVENRFGGDSCETTALVAVCIAWVYRTSNAYEMGDHKVTLADFDRVRYFINEVDSNAYMTCID